MKRLLFHIMLLITAAIPASAQTGLAVEAFFADNLPHAPAADVTSVAITGGKLKPHDLSVYRSVSVTGDASLADRMERAVKRDGIHAESREVSLKGGRIYFGFYSLPAADSENRYLFYLNSTLAGGNKTTLIYMQGAATPDKIKRMLNNSKQ